MFHLLHHIYSNSNAACDNSLLILVTRKKLLNIVILVLERGNILLGSKSEWRIWIQKWPKLERKALIVKLDRVFEYFVQCHNGG